ncbi:MAG: aminotransferase class IV [Treponema sp.]
MIFDLGFQAGIGAFETIAVYNKKPLFLPEHIKRLNNALVFLGIQKTITVDPLLNYIAKTQQKTYALKIMVSEKNTIIKKRSNPYLKSPLYIEGAKLKYSSILKNETSPLTYHKTLAYSQNLLEKQKATKEGMLDFIFCNTKGFIAEGSVCNIFFTKDKNIFTPSISSGLLPGILRAYVISKYTVKEQLISKEFILDADECFITNSLMGIMPIKTLDNKTFTIGKQTNSIMKEYENMIKSMMNHTKI